MRKTLILFALAVAMLFMSSTAVQAHVPPTSEVTTERSYKVGETVHIDIVIDWGDCGVTVMCLVQSHIINIMEEGWYIDGDTVVGWVNQIPVYTDEPGWYPVNLYADWDQTDFDGNQVKPGKYVAYYVYPDGTSDPFSIIGGSQGWHGCGHGKASEHNPHCQ